MAGFIGNKPTNVPLSSSDLPDNIVTSAKIADDAVDSDQLASGAVDDAHLATGISSSKLTGTLPALNASSLTNLDARDLENALPAISGANLTGISGGKVLQVVASSNNTTNATTSTSEVDTANTVTITPTLATSKVLLYWSHPSMYTQSTDKIKMYLYMGGVSQGTLGDRIGEQNSGHSSMSGMRLFSPNSTSAVVFKTTYKRMAGGGTIFSNIYTGNQTMVAIEIGV
tara:strand:+ start:85 stop:768 length:684 start_codon:yes stop_codon:yes gene_type:complete